MSRVFTIQRMVIEQRMKWVMQEEISPFLKFRLDQGRYLFVFFYKLLVEAYFHFASKYASISFAVVNGPIMFLPLFKSRSTSAINFFVFAFGMEGVENVTLCSRTRSRK